MAHSIPSCSFKVNSQSFSSSYSPKATRLFLSKTQIRILFFFYALRTQDGIEVSNYSLLELSVKLKLTKTYLSSLLAELESLGLLGSDPAGSANKRRWITWEGFCVLENQNGIQTVNQPEPILYNNLSDRRNDPSKIIEEEQICEQVDIEQELNTFLDKEGTSYSERVRIKKAIKTSPIGPVRRESLIRRVIAAAKKSFIPHKLAYFLKALQKELKDMNEFILYLAKNGGEKREYDLSNLDDLGCFVM